MHEACPSGILSDTLWKIDFNINILKFLGQAWPLHGSFPPQAPLFFRPKRKEPQEFIEGDKHHGQAIFLRGILEKQLVSQLKISYDLYGLILILYSIFTLLVLKRRNANSGAVGFFTSFAWVLEVPPTHHWNFCGVSWAVIALYLNGDNAPSNPCMLTHEKKNFPHEKIVCRKNISTRLKWTLRGLV